jgi:hypothetical protein
MHRTREARRTSAGDRTTRSNGLKEAYEAVWNKTDAFDIAEDIAPAVLRSGAVAQVAHVIGGAGRMDIIKSHRLQAAQEPLGVQSA